MWGEEPDTLTQIHESELANSLREDVGTSTAHFGSRPLEAQK